MLNEFRRIDFTWDKASRKIYDLLRTSSSDENGRKLVVQVLNNGSTVNLEGTELRLYWEFDEHKGFDDFELIDEDNGIYEIHFSTDMVSHVGAHKAWLHLVDAEGTVTSEPFTVTVFEGVDTDTIQDSNEFSALSNALVAISDLETNYAPRLNSVENNKADKATVNSEVSRLDQKDADLTAQLAQTEAKKADKTYVEEKVDELEQKDDSLNTQLTQTATSKVDKDGSGQVKWSNLAQDARENISGNKVAVVEDDSVITTNLTDNVIKTSKIGKNEVTAETTNFINTSTNLFNRDDIVYGRVIQTDGTIVTRDDYHYSHEIDVLPSQTLFTRNIQSLAFCNQSGEFLRRIDISGLDLPSSFTVVPGEAYYVRGNIQKQRFDNPQLYDMQISISTTEIPYEPFYQELSKGIKVDLPPITNEDLPQIDASKFEFMETSTNLFNIEDITLGKVISSAGEVVENQYYGYSHPVIVSPNAQITINGIYFVAFYDKDENFISRLGSFDGETVTITVPTNAFIARFNFLTTHSAYKQKIIQVNYGSTLQPFEPFGIKLKKEFIPNTIVGKMNKHTFDTSLEGVFNTQKTFDDYTTNGWATIHSSEVYAMVDEIQTTYPDYITKQELEPDATGLEISAYHLNPQRPQMTNRKPYPTVYIVTGTHGYERSSVINMYHLVKELCESWKNSDLLEALRFNVNIIWIPIVNPHGWSVGGGAKYQRYNSNGIDIARQFPDDWVKQDPTSNTYGGEAPLTEVEALNVKQIFDENPNIDIFYDYHNFGDVVDHYIWLATASSHSEQLGEALIKKMSRKWSSEFTFIPEDKVVGYTSIMNQGTMHNYAYKSLGIERSGTFETNNQFHLDLTSVKYNQDSVKAGLESIVNFLIINLRDLIE